MIARPSVMMNMSGGIPQTGKDKQKRLSGLHGKDLQKIL
jgi:hypothetical protein